METEKKLIRKLQKNNFKQNIILFLSVYFILFFTNFILLNYFSYKYFSSLLKSQNYFISTRNWRTLINGINSGWQFFPKIKSLCIYDFKKNLVASYNTCLPLMSKKSNFFNFLSGKIATANIQNFNFILYYNIPLWIMSTIISFSILLPILCFYFVLKKIFLLKNQLSLINDFHKIFHSFQQNKQKLNDFEKIIKIKTNEIIDLKKQSLLGEISSQVAHDIRSPLSALNLTVRSLQNIPENKKQLLNKSINRINEIACDLINYIKTKNIPSSEYLSTIKHQHTITNNKNYFAINNFLPYVLDSIIQEKKIQYQKYNFIKISLTVKNHMQLFTNFPMNEFKRIISNLINNSYEAIIPDEKNKTKNIEIIVSKQKQFIKINIKDTGKGIPANILKKLGKEKISYDKKKSVSALGLAIFYAIKKIESYKGELKFYSKANQGCNVKITLPIENHPIHKNILEKIDLSSKRKIVIVDDEPLIFRLWKEKISQKNKIIYFSSLKKFKKYYYNYYTNNKNNIKEFLFLIDHKFKYEKEKGLEVIKKLGITDLSVLASNNFNDDNLIKNCLENNLKIIPKELIPWVSIT